MGLSKVMISDLRSWGVGGLLMTFFWFFGRIFRDGKKKQLSVGQLKGTFGAWELGTVSGMVCSDYLYSQNLMNSCNLSCHSILECHDFEDR